MWLLGIGCLSIFLAHGFKNTLPGNYIVNRPAAPAAECWPVCSLHETCGSVHLASRGSVGWGKRC